MHDIGGSRSLSGILTHMRHYSSVCVSIKLGRKHANDMSQFDKSLGHMKLIYRLLHNRQPFDFRRDRPHIPTHCLRIERTSSWGIVSLSQ